MTAIVRIGILLGWMKDQTYDVSVGFLHLNRTLDVARCETGDAQSKTPEVLGSSRRAVAH